MTSFTVSQTEVRLHVTHHGQPLNGEAPTIVFVHGFPDTHHAWSDVRNELAERYATVAYDVRGAGQSSAPARRSGYRIARLADDLVAVLDTVRADGAPVHLVGHDWGSVQLWGILQQRDPRLEGRIASFTSISGPPIELYTRFLRGAVHGPDRRGSLDQLLHSWYVAAFQIPGMAEFVFRRFGQRLGATISRAERVPDLFADSLPHDGANGVNLYRANTTFAPFRGVDVPVQVIVPRHDPYVGVPMMESVIAEVKPQRRVDLEAGHWVIRSKPSEVAAEIASFIENSSL